MKKPIRDAIAAKGQDVTAALLDRGALVGGQDRRSGRDAATRAHDGRALVEHVLRKFYNGTTPANARRRSRYDDVLERGRAGAERVLIRAAVLPLLETAGVLDRTQRGVYVALSVNKDANGEVVNFLYRSTLSGRLADVIKRVEQERMTA